MRTGSTSAIAGCSRLWKNTAGFHSPTTSAGWLKPSRGGAATSPDTMTSRSSWSNEPTRSPGQTARREMATHPPTPSRTAPPDRSGRSLGADIIIANAPDPVFVSDLEGKILQANDAVSQLLGFRPDELIE